MEFSKIRNGHFIVVEDEVYRVIEFHRISDDTMEMKLRNMKTWNTSIFTFTKEDIVRKKMHFGEVRVCEFSYIEEEADGFMFMNMDTYESCVLAKNVSDRFMISFDSLYNYQMSFINNVLVDVRAIR